MKFTVLGSGGCMIIPKPLCGCSICAEAREKGVPFSRTGPSAFLHDENILIDTPAEIAGQLNRSGINQISHLIFTHLDPDHIEGFRIVEQIALDFRSWRAYPDKKIRLVLPRPLYARLGKVCTAYGSQAGFYEKSGFISIHPFDGTTRIGDVRITALPVDRGEQVAFVYVFEKKGEKIIYAPCDVKPFPEDNPIVQDADYLFIQPGIVDGNLKHGFVYPADHISRSTLYTLQETITLSGRINAKQTVFIHIEEYWNKSYSDYAVREKKYENIMFAWDGMHINTKLNEELNEAGNRGLSGSGP